MVLEENWDAVRVFAVSATQWRLAPSGHRAGLDYAGVRVVAESLGASWEDVLWRVRLMEAPALECWDAAT